MNVQLTTINKLIVFDFFGFKLTEIKRAKSGVFN